MIQPLALVCYEKLMPGSQLVNRLQDLGYRVQTIAGAGQLVAAAEQHKPMLAVVDLASNHHDVCEIIAALRRTAAVHHLPVIAFTAEEDAALQAAAQQAGATVVVHAAALLHHLGPLLDRALEVN